MPSHHDSSYFQPPPPIRTATSGSQKSVSSGAASPDMLSPTTTFSRAPRSPTSPAEGSFFGAITSRIRGRSHSRNREASHKRSKSPMVMPPEHLPATNSARPMAPTFQRPQRPQHKSTASQSSTVSASKKPTRPSMSSNPARRSTSSSNGSDLWHGRHSNSWLFNDFSVTEHAKDLLHLGRKP
ncbi:hypothetical protein K458DRAFT_420526 [Lentithecium fluviatile CBS 122367]|uniref:Uncharacterized protein n=1 Tax=Lentithecium fluviatile CBS 122367 TaxID=1168545 RepID=A0A6G1IU40_9PLEO|nr:hypothetical protein K458DRAFT_420526 [Lentithecium fluviatile CBS 122367]